MATESGNPLSAAASFYRPGLAVMSRAEALLETCYQLTTTNDVLGLFIYLGLATLLVQHFT